MAGIDTFHGLLFCLRTWMDPLFRVEKNITSLHARLSLAFASPGCNFDDFGWSNWGDFPLQTRCKSLTTWRGMVGLVTSTGGLCDDRWDWGHPTVLQWTDRIQDGDYLVVSLNQLLTYFKHLHKVHDFICSRNWSQKQQIRAKTPLVLHNAWPSLGDGRISGMLGITLSYHRQLSHRSFATQRWQSAVGSLTW